MSQVSTITYAVQVVEIDQLRHGQNTVHIQSQLTTINAL